MKNLFLALIMLAVVITVNQPPQIIPCPQPEPRMEKSADGTYYRSQDYSTTLQVCYGESKPKQELWTDYPEKGGTFIKVVGDE
jgi:hypothetical protein